ncbi:unnamed protein product [Ceutorhynchus assimilis]|uniref:VWFC domain-containing protein n=1 Tax=Ceutorhynchus assimilis TaxID=467358 RepID=A0A9P0DGG4_9CUCU|nr:unnamed protein product [Ceutorhynchus assimilis]
MKAWTQLLKPGSALVTLLLTLIFATQTQAAPALGDQIAEQSTEIEYYPVADATGCYYNFQHYDEGDRIITNEPCLNCTCHNRMLMCYLRVCPFTKAIGANCKVEKRPDQCCPVITCPEVPVELVTSTAPSTALGHINEYGCSIDKLFYADGARVPSNPENPCELCYCIRNKTACVMQECTLNVEGCRPVFQEGVCCPVRYNCEHPDYLEGPTTPQITTTTTTTTTTTEAPTTTIQPTFECDFHGVRYNDGEMVKKDIPCEKCYCMRGDIVCAVQECGPTPLDKVNCTALPVREGQCCPETYDCAGVIEEELTTLASVSYEIEPTTQPNVFEGKVTQQSLTTVQIEEEQKEEASTETPELGTKAALPEETLSEGDKGQTKIEEEGPSTPEIIEEIIKEPAEVPETAEQATEKATEEVTTALIQESEETEKPESVTKVGVETTEKESVTIITAITPEGPGPELPTTISSEVSSKKTLAEEESKTTESPVESFTSRVTEAIESITSRVTEAVEAITTAISGSTEQPITVPIKEASEISTESGLEQQTEEFITKASIPEEEPAFPTHPAESEQPSVTEKEQPETSPEDYESDKAGVTPADSEKEKPESSVTEVSKKETELEAATESSGGEEQPTTIEAIALPEEQPTTKKAEEQTTIAKQEEKPEGPIVLDKEQGQETELPTDKPKLPQETVTGTEIESLVTEEATTAAVETEKPSEEQSTETFKETFTELPAITDEQEPTKEVQKVVTEESIVPEKCEGEKCARKPTEEGTTKLPAAIDHPTAGVSEQPTEESQPTLAEQPTTEAKSEQPTATEQPERISEQTEKAPQQPVTEQSKPEIEASEQEIETEIPATTEEEVVIVTEISAKKTEIPESMDHVSELISSTGAPKEFAPTTVAPVEVETEQETSTGSQKQPEAETEKAQPEAETEKTLPEVSSEAPEAPGETPAIGEKPEAETTGVPVQTPTEQPKVPEEHTESAITDEKSTEKVSEITTETPKEEENEIEHVDSPKTPEQQPATVSSVAEEEPTEEIETTEPEIKKDVSTPPDSSVTEEQITEKAIVPEVCTSETECAPAPSVPKAEEPASSIKPEEVEDVKIPAETTETNRIPEEPTDETNEIPETGTEMVKSTESVHTESSGDMSSDISTEPPTKEEEGSGEAPQEGSGASEEILPEVTEPTSVTKLLSSTEQSESESITTKLSEKVPSSTTVPTESTFEFATTETGSNIPETTEEVLPEREIPGEGSCLVDGQTYKNNSSVPPINHCQISCRCASSILRCDSIECTPPPPGLQNCLPIFNSPDSCCPTYSCTGPEATSPMESDSNVVQTTTIASEEIQTLKSRLPENTEMPDEATSFPTQPAKEISETSAEITTAKVETEAHATETSLEEAEEPKNEIVTEIGEATTQSIPEEATEQVTNAKLPQLEISSTETAEPEATKKPTQELATSEKTTQQADDETSAMPEFEPTEKPLQGEKPENVSKVVEEGQATEQPIIGVEEQTETATELPVEHETNIPEIVLPEEVTKAPEVIPETTEKGIEQEAATVDGQPKPETEQSEEPKLTTEISEVVEKATTSSPHHEEPFGTSEPHGPVTELPVITKEGTEAPVVPETKPSEAGTEEHISEVPESRPLTEIYSASTPGEELVEHVTMPAEEMGTPKPIESDSHVTIQQPTKEGEQTTDEVIVTDTPQLSVEQEKKITKPQEGITETPEEHGVKGSTPAETELGKEPTEKGPAESVVTETQTNEISTSEEVTEEDRHPSATEELPPSVTERVEKLPSEDATIPEQETESPSPVAEEASEKSTQQHVTAVATEEPSTEENEIPGAEQDKEGYSPAPHIPSEGQKAGEATEVPEKPSKEEGEMETERPSSQEKSQTTLPTVEVMSQTSEPEDQTAKLPEAVTSPTSSSEPPAREPVTEQLPAEGTSKSALSEETTQTQRPQPEKEGVTGETVISTGDEEKLTTTENPIISSEETEKPSEFEEESKPAIPSETERPVLSEEETKTGTPSGTEKTVISEEESKTAVPSEAEKPVVPEEETKTAIPSETERPAESEEKTETAFSTETERPIVSEEEIKKATPSEVGKPALSEEEIKTVTGKPFAEEAKPSGTEKPLEGGETTPSETEKIATTEKEIVPSETEKSIESQTTRPGLSEEETKATIPSEAERPAGTDEEMKTATPGEETRTTTSRGTEASVSLEEETEATKVAVEGEPTEKSTSTPEEAIGAETEQPIVPEKPAKTEAIATKAPESVTISYPQATEQPISFPGETIITQKPVEVYTSSPEATTELEEKLNISLPSRGGELFTSGSEAEATTKPHVPGELSTSAPVSEPTTILPATTSTELPFNGEQVPEPGDYEQPGEEYEDEDQNAFGPGTCRYGGKIYVSAQQIPREDPCDFCFCFRSDIICLQQSCPPPIPRCHEEPIRGFCCPRYECPVSMATAVNVTTSTTTTTTTLPPHFLSHAFKGRAAKTGCQISGRAYKVGDVIRSTSGPCLHCTCGGDGQMKCDPKPCSPEPMLRQMIAAAALRRRR